MTDASAGQSMPALAIRPDSLNFPLKGGVSNQKVFSMNGGAWSCPHEREGRCGKVGKLPCDPGMKGCELYGRYVFFDAGKNTRLKEKQARQTATGTRMD